jgi:hypothetical protein
MKMSQSRFAIVALWTMGVLSGSPAVSAARADDPTSAARKPGDVRRYLEQALKAVKAIEEPPQQAKAELQFASQKVVAMAQISLAQSKAGDKVAAAETLRQAFAFAQGVQEHDPHMLSLREIADAEVERGDVPAALRVAAAGRDEEGRTYVLSAIVRGQAAAGDIAGALKSAEGLKDYWHHAAIVDVATAQARTGDVRGALKTVAALENEPFQTARALQEIALAEAKAGDKPRAKKTLQAARQLIEIAKAPRPGTGQLAMLAVRQAEIGDVQGGLQTLAAAKLDEHPGFGHFHSRFVVQQVLAGDAAGALRSIDGLKDVERQVSALLQVAVAQADKGDRAGARQTIRMAQQRQGSRGAGGKHDTYRRSLARAQAKTGDFAGALATAKAIQDAGTRASALRDIAKVQVAAGDRAGALATLKQAAAAARTVAPAGAALEALGHAQDIRFISRDLAELGAEAEALPLAAEQAAPFAKALGFVGIAEGVTGRTAGKRPAPER